MSSFTQYASFGSGILVLKTSVANVPYMNFGALQDVNLTIKGKLESLRAQKVIPIDSAISELDITAKVKTGWVSGALYAAYFAGATVSTGTVKLASAESATIPSATAYTVTVANATNFVEDFGVTYTATGVPLVPVTGTPTTGQYAVNASTGVYTFASTDAGLGVQITYTYGDSTAGSTIAVPNALQGLTNKFSVILYRGRNNTGERFLLNGCVASNLQLPTTMGKFAVSDFDLSVTDPGDGTNPLTIYTDA